MNPFPAELRFQIDPLTHVLTYIAPVPDPLLAPVANPKVYDKCLSDGTAYVAFGDSGLVAKKATPIFGRDISAGPVPPFKGTTQQVTVPAGTKFDLLDTDFRTIEGEGQLLESTQVDMPCGTTFRTPEVAATNDTPRILPVDGAIGHMVSHPIHCFLLTKGVSMKNGTVRAKTDVEYLIRFRPGTLVDLPAQSPVILGIKTRSEVPDKITINPDYV